MEESKAVSSRPFMTRAEAVAQILAQVDGPIALDELAQRVLALCKSQAKDPLGGVRTFIRTEENGGSLVLVDDRTVLPLRIAMRGVRFRCNLSKEEIQRGVLFIDPAFDCFLSRQAKPDTIRLRDAQGSLPVRLVYVRKTVNTIFGKQGVEYPAFDLGDWLRAHRARHTDSILVTIEDWEQGHFLLEYEPIKRKRWPEVTRKDRELADILFDMLEDQRSESLIARVAIRTAYARMADPRGYPGNHWHQVIAEDGRMRYDGFMILYGDVRSPFEEMWGEERAPEEKPFSAAQGRQVYRFKATLRHRPGLWRKIEIQGRQTLAELDAVLRSAFQHDPWDHLGGFWKLVPRGKSGRFREVDIGNVDPLGEGDGAGLRIAGLGLQPGDKLKYVYDFGDWIEHTLTLEKIGEPQAGAEYPCIVAQNKPRYQNCVSCRAEGIESRAIWICLTCSGHEQRPVLLCDRCAKEHDDHDVGEILY